MQERYYAKKIFIIVFFNFIMWNLHYFWRNMSRANLNFSYYWNDYSNMLTSNFYV